MTGADRRAQILDIAADEFARGGLHGTSAETDPVAVKTFLAFGMLLNASAAMALAGLDDGWAAGVRTRIHAGLFRHITTESNQ